MRSIRHNFQSQSTEKLEAIVTLPDSISERARQGAKVRREVLGAAYVDAGKQKANAFTQHFEYPELPVPVWWATRAPPISAPSRIAPA